MKFKTLSIPKKKIFWNVSTHVMRQPNNTCANMYVWCVCVSLASSP